MSLGNCTRSGDFKGLKLLVPAEHAHTRGVHATGIDVVKHSHLTHHLAT